MLSFFRRFTKSRLGVFVTMGVLAVIALAFAAGDITGLRGNQGGSVLGGGVASVGGETIGEAEIRNRMQVAFSSYRQQQPTLDMAAFVNGGGLDVVLDRSINGVALQRFANSIGMVASKQAVDGEIASIPAFQGPDGTFSQPAYEQVLQQQRLTDKGVREDIARESLSRQLLGPTLGASQIPTNLALPYASLLLEKRQGTVGFIPTTAITGGAAPTDAEIQTYYTRQRARYVVPERRAIRYGVVKASDIAAGAKPTDAEIAAAYRSQAARFAATEKRTLTQVIVADQAGANAIAAKVKAGTPITTAARAAGLEANVATGVDRTAFGKTTSAEVASAAFGAVKGAVVGPIRGSLGWSVLRVDAIEPVAGKTLAQATPELSVELAKIKAAEALGKIHDSLDDSIADNATFDELMSDAKLTAATTKPLLVSGIDPDAPTAQPDPMLASMAQAAFAAEQGDAPQLVQVGADGSFAVVAMGQVIPAAPRPLAQIRDVVVKDFTADRAMRAARAAAAAAVAKIDKGTPFAQALQQTGLSLPAARPLNASRAQLASQGGQVPPALALMFSMAPKRAKLLEAPNRSGWYIVYLDTIQGGNAAGNTALVTTTRRGLGSVSGQELAEQFAAAVRNTVGVKRDATAIARVRGELAGTAAPAAK